jgi:hypothetical protein
MAGILLEGDHVTDEERAAHACALEFNDMRRFRANWRSLGGH